MEATAKATEAQAVLAVVDPDMMLTPLILICDSDVEEVPEKVIEPVELPGPVVTTGVTPLTEAGPVIVTVHPELNAL